MMGIVGLGSNLYLNFTLTFGDQVGILALFIFSVEMHKHRLFTTEISDL